MTLTCPTCGIAFTVPATRGYNRRRYCDAHSKTVAAYKPCPECGDAVIHTSATMCRACHNRARRSA